MRAAFVALLVSLTFGGSLCAQEADRDEASEQFNRIDEGDPQAVAIGLKWLAESVVHADDIRQRPKMFAALATCDAFELNEAGPDLVALYRVAANLPQLRSAIARAAASIATPESKRFLEILRDDDSLEPMIRVRVLSALLELGDSAARDGLLALTHQWIKWVGAAKPAPNELAVIPFTLRRLDDQAVMDDLEQQLAKESDLEKQKAIQRVLEYMRANRLSVEELFKMISETRDVADKYKVYAAMYAIGRKGELRDIERLRTIEHSLKPSTQSTDGPGGIDFGDAKLDAIGDIRRHHWRALLVQKTTRGS